MLKYQILEKPRLLMRGLWGAGTEMALATLVYNLKRVMGGAGNVRNGGPVGTGLSRLSAFPTLTHPENDNAPQSGALVKPASGRFDTA